MRTRQAPIGFARNFSLCLEVGKHKFVIALEFSDAGEWMSCMGGWIRWISKLSIWSKFEYKYVFYIVRQSYMLKYASSHEFPILCTLVNY